MRDVFHVPGRVRVQWEPSVRAIVDTWDNYVITVDQFREAVLDKGLNFAKANRGRAWIVDSSKATGYFPREVQAILDEVFETFSKNGISHFLTITSQSVVTNMGIKAYSSKAGPHGVRVCEVSSVSEGIALLRREYAQAA